MGILGMLGKTVDDKVCLSVTMTKQFYEDVTEKEVPRNFQIARQFVDWCKNSGVDPENVGIDSTGGGVVFAEILMQEWSTRINKIQFGGAASDLPISATDLSY